ncbi:ABC transporter substrate-binding protein [bacterium]|nr:ABC transporter substrate-binding protein [Candidatus Atribacteria bacterium]MBU1290252.1 ABC transporter substrate-binding protein [bacterium]MBU1428696.1 ABC transporter substrate-binding protein [bacterium]MBU2439575.1 ABC transporter substrate-binding protein [bacterium]MBU4047053.1 ABC transporter substrate-binding protein [bacterium]
MKKTLVILLAISMLFIFSATSMAETEIRIVGWGGTDQSIVEELINLFVVPELADKGITAIYEPIVDDFQANLINSLSAGTAGDLFYMDIFWAEYIIKAGQVEPLDDYLAKSTVISKDDIIPSLLNAFSFDGKAYGIPKDFNSLALVYNKDLFDVAGVPYPDEKDTWEDLENKFSKLVKHFEGEVTGLALAPEFARFGAFAYAAGWEPFVDGKTNLMDPAFLEAFNWYVGLKEKGLGIMPADIGQGWGGGALTTEKVAAALEGAWILGFLRDNAPNLKYGATLLPKNPRTGQPGNFIYTVAWGINANSKNKDAAFKVMEALTSPAAQQWILERGLAIPSRKALADNPYFEKDTPEAQANKIVFLGASAGNVKPFKFKEYGGQWMDPINVALSEVMSGQKTVDEALEMAQEQLNELMK